MRSGACRLLQYILVATFSFLLASCAMFAMFSRFPLTPEGYLHWNALQGNANDVAALLARGVDIEARDEFGSTALMIAAERGHLRAVEVLIDAGADVNAISTDLKRTPLLLAADSGHPDVVRLLLDAGAVIDQSNGRGNTALMLAVTGVDLGMASNHPETVRILIAAGADLNKTNNYGWHALAFARSAAMARILLDAGAVADSSTFLIVAEHGIPISVRHEVVALMLKTGVDVNAKSEEGRTAISYLTSNADTIRLLLDVGADPNIRDNFGRGSLFYAVRNKRIAAIMALVEGGADVDAQDNTGRTYLSHASQHGELEVMQALISAGADPDIADGMGRTALSHASIEGHVDGIRMLIDAGAFLDTTDAQGRTALSYAIKSRNHSIVQALVQAGADLEAETDHAGVEIRMGALATAIVYNDPELAEYLIESGAEVNPRTSLGVTPLMIAARRGFLRTVKALVDAGADVNAVDHEGKTVLNHAYAGRNADRIRFLRSVGAVLERVSQ